MGKIWPFGAKNSLFQEVAKVLINPHNRKPPRHLVCIVFWSGMGSNESKMSIEQTRPGDRNSAVSFLDC